MKVLIIPQYARTGGALTYLLNLLQIHQSEGIETVVLIERSSAYPEITEMIHRMGARLFIGPNRPACCLRSLYSFLYDLAFSMRAFFSLRPDIVHVSNCTPSLQHGLLLWPASVLFMMHTYPDTRVSRRYRFFPSRWAGPRKIFATVSQFSARRIISTLRVPESFVHVLYNSHLPAPRTRAPSGQTVLTASHIVGYKNPDVWFEVAKQVIRQDPQARFVWIGEGAERAKLLARIGQESLQERILAPGHCADVDAWYDQAAICFQPSLVESHGIAVVDAMARGLPCVTSNVGGLPESVVDGETGFTHSPEDVEGFASSILSLLMNEDLRRSLGEAGRQRAEEIFSPEAQKQKILDLYRMLTSDSCGLAKGRE